MKRINDLSANSFNRLVFAFFSFCAIIAAVCMPDRSTMFTGLWNIITNPGKVVTNYFWLGGYSATFLNIGLTCLVCTLFYFLPGATANAVSTLSFFLVFGFCAWGMNIMNVWPSFAGVALYALVKKEKLGAHANAMLLSTGLAPLISDLMFRYPNAEVVKFTWGGCLLAICVGLVIGFMLPAGLTHAPKVHKGYDHYSAALPMGMLSFFLHGIFYKVMGGSLPAAPDSSTLQVASGLICNTFAGVCFVLCILVSFLMGCRPKDYWNLLKDPGYSVDFSKKYGNAAFLMNLGVFGLFILAYYNLIGATFNGATFGVVFCMLAACNCGSHPRNVLPIMLGYVAASFAFSYLYIGSGSYAQAVNAQAIVIGLCYANGLSPITGRYGPIAGFFMAVCHFLLVTSVPSMHGGFLLHNGGFTAALICLLFVPQLERFFPDKAEQKTV